MAWRSWTHVGEIIFDKDFNETGGMIKQGWIVLFDSRRMQVVGAWRDGERGRMMRLMLKELVA